jgi:hypothetical protein
MAVVMPNASTLEPASVSGMLNLYSLSSSENDKVDISCKEALPTVASEAVLAKMGLSARES